MSGRGRDVVVAIGMSIIAMAAAVGVHKGFLQEPGAAQPETAAPAAVEEAAPAPPEVDAAIPPKTATVVPAPARQLEQPTDLTPRLAAIEKLLSRHGIDERTADSPRLDQLAAEIERLRADVRRLELLVEQEESGEAEPAERSLEPSDQEVRMRPAQSEQVAALEVAKAAPAAEDEGRVAREALGDGGQSRVYNVQQGDTLTRIARSLCLPVAELQSMNPELGDIDQLRVGQALRYRETQACGDGRADRTKAST